MDVSDSLAEYAAVAADLLCLQSMLSEEQWDEVTEFIPALQRRMLALPIVVGQKCTAQQLSLLRQDIEVISKLIEVLEPSLRSRHQELGQILQSAANEGKLQRAYKG